MTQAAIPKGRFTRNAQRQSPSCTSRPPIGGPSPDARAADAPHSPTACVRRSAGNAATTSAKEAGTSMAAPRAWTTRAPMRNATDGESAQTTEATVKTRTPQTNARRRPIRSVIRPNGTRNAAKTML